jgi:hypothetical protein
MWNHIQSINSFETRGSISIRGANGDPLGAPPNLFRGAPLTQFEKLVHFSELERFGCAPKGFSFSPLISIHFALLLV